MALNPFQWKKDGGLGLRISTDASPVIAHEVFYEDALRHVPSEHSLFVGKAIPGRRFTVIGIILCGIIGALFVRTAWMQVMQGQTYQLQAERNRLRTEILLPRRGVIRDRNGILLAENIPAFDLYMTERLLPNQKEYRDELLGKISRAIGVSVAEIEGVFASSTDPDEEIAIDHDLPYDRALAIRILTASEPGIEVRSGMKRRYPESTHIPSLSHVLGYVAGITREELEQKRTQGYRQVDTLGKIGIESTYESLLRGTPGEAVYEVDSQHHVTTMVKTKNAVEGQDLTLTIDRDLQEATEQALRRGLERAQSTRGAAIVLDPRDGSVLASVSLPTYDNNIFSGRVSSTKYHELIENPDHPLLPRVWAGIYPSGSTIKPVIAVTGLAEQVITPSTSIVSQGGIRVGPWFFPDWKAGGHGSVNVRSAIAWSVNTFFYYLGGGYEQFVGLGVGKLTEWMKRFGLGEKTGLDIPGEQRGFVPSPEWKQATKGEPWYIGDTYNLSIGQGDLLVTPLQIAYTTAIIANGGHRIQPHFLLHDVTPTSTLIAPKEAIQTVRQGMREGVVYGSGRALASFPVSVAGKTGTAQWRQDKKNHAWFTAFAPFDQPEVVVTVLIEEGDEGSASAVPVAKDILQAWFDKSRRAR